MLDEQPQCLIRVRYIIDNKGAGGDVREGVGVRAATYAHVFLNTALLKPIKQS